MSDLHAFDPKKTIHSKILNRSICMPSMVQSYSLCIEFMKEWFLAKFDEDYFKSIYIDGKYIYDDFRTLSKLQLLKREKPSLAIVPTVDWDFDNDKIDLYPYGLTHYAQTGKFKGSFLTDHTHSTYLSLGLETILMRFSYHMRFETRAQQMDMFKYIKMSHRVGFSDVNEVDLDFHIPYVLMIQIAQDLGFNTYIDDTATMITDIPGFLKYLNMHSAIPFLYKHRTINGKHEFFIRMQRMSVNIRPNNLSADDGEREGMLTNNFALELECEVRFPAPRMYAYYSESEHHLKTVYTTWDQNNGMVSTFYTFKGTPIPDTNRNGWPMFMNTSYEDDVINKNKTLSIDFTDLIQGDIGAIIIDSLNTGISPSIFCDFIIVNGGEVVTGAMDWERLTFNSDREVRSLGSFIGIYVDMNYVNNALINKREMANDRVTLSKHPETRQKEGES